MQVSTVFQELGLDHTHVHLRLEDFSVWASYLVSWKDQILVPSCPVESVALGSSLLMLSWILNSDSHFLLACICL